MTAQNPKRKGQAKSAGNDDARDNRGRFAKGHTGTSKGQNQHTKQDRKAKAIDFARRLSPEMLRIAAAIARDTSASAADRLKAVNTIVDRGLGKPETAGNHATGLFAGATIMVDTGIKRELEPPTVDVTPNGVDSTESSTD